MKKLTLTLLLSFIAIQLSAQDDKKLLFEAESGLAFYRNTEAPPLSSFYLRFGTVAGKYFQTGILINGYTANAKSYYSNQWGNQDSYLTRGGRGGVFLKASEGKESHLYAELQGTFGVVAEIEDSETHRLEGGMEYGGGVNIGYNVAFANSSYFGVYLGAEVGDWMGSGITYTRFNFGLRFQSRY